MLSGINGPNSDSCQSVNNKNEVRDEFRFGTKLQSFLALMYSCVNLFFHSEYSICMTIYKFFHLSVYLRFVQSPQTMHNEESNLSWLFDESTPEHHQVNTSAGEQVRF